ncbi:hypothetical protein HMPREF9136_1645 [Prevotella dentalis DSM 3688]|uniref:Uncharacterized protein n=1 Tax=Prevotella dentalis (strain ATCC 49559 / DSM 3688 / JCM 13448 / NCTC 12043 / ES 2772) TaxID=908937 RepID=F9D467_PREDD|nr:hypothetical protein HMPREF9136_1645 [Prevotella dentalis DSM 3688]
MVSSYIKALGFVLFVKLRPFLGTRKLYNRKIFHLLIHISNYNFKIRVSSNLIEKSSKYLFLRRFSHVFLLFLYRFVVPLRKAIITNVDLKSSAA